MADRDRHRTVLLLVVCVVVGLAGPGGVALGAPAPTSTTALAQDDNPYDDDDGEGPIVDPEEVVVRSNDQTVISGAMAERGGQAATVETEGGVSVVVNDDEELVTEDGNRVMTVSGTVINRFDVDQGSDVRTADEPFEQLSVDGDGQIVTGSGEPVVDSEGNVLVANPDGIDYDVEFLVENVEATNVDEGQTVDVTATINNTGIATGEQTIQAMYRGEVVANQTVSVEGEATGSVSVSFDTEAGDWGFDQEVRVQSANDSAATTINVSRGGLQVVDSSWNAPVQAGENFSTSLTISRVGEIGPDRKISYETVFLIEGDVQIRRIVSLGQGESATESFEYPTDTDDPPRLPHTVTVGDREFDATIRVFPPVFDVDVENVTKEVEAGEVVRIDGTVRNEGAIEDEQSIELQLNDSAGDDSWRTVANQSVRLGSGNATNVSFYYRTSAGTPQSSEFRMASPATNASESVSVERVDTDLEVVDVVAGTDSVAPGEVVRFNVTIENTGETNESATVSLEQGPELYHERDVTVPGGEQTTVTLPAQAPSTGGTYQYEAVIPGDAATTDLVVEGNGTPTENETGGGGGNDTGVGGNDTTTDDGNTTGGNETTGGGNETTSGNGTTTGGNETTGEGNETTSNGNETTGGGNETTGGNETSGGNETNGNESTGESTDDEEGIPWVTIGGGVLLVLLLVGIAVAATRTDRLPVDVPDSPGAAIQTARASAAVAAGTVVNQLPVDVDIGIVGTGQVTVANVSPDQVRFKIRCRTPDEVTLFEDRALAASDSIDLEGLPASAPVKIEINVQDGPRDDIEVLESKPLSAAQVVIQPYDVDFTVE